jgi:hypothetical protein
MRNRTSILVLLGTAGALLAADPARAAGFTVNATVDHAEDACESSPGDCTVRDAIAAANAAPGADTITIPAGTYGLSAGALRITGPVTISGRAATPPAATIDAGYGDRVLDVAGAAGAVTISYLTIARGQSPDATGGSGLLQRGGTVTLDHDVFEGHSNNLSGGALLQQGGTLNVTDTEVRGGHAYRGGGLFVAAGTANVSRTLWLSNDGTTGGGGAIYNAGGALTVADSTFADNSAGSSHGGAVYAAVPTTLSNVTFEANVASGNQAGGSALWTDTTTTTTTANVLFGNSAYGSSCGGKAPNDLGGSVDAAASCGLAAAASERTVRLGPLALNGGAARSLLPWSDSTGIDAGDDERCTSADQRSAPRSRTSADPCDVGALEGDAGSAAPPPLLAGGSQRRAAETEVELDATIDRRGLATTYVVEYGPTEAYGLRGFESSVAFGVGAQPVSAYLGELAPATTYHYRFVSTSAAGTTIGPDRTFSTLGPPPAETRPASEVSATGATLNGAVDGLAEETTYRFEYGPTTAYGSSTEIAGARIEFGKQAVSAVLSGLTAGMTYHFRVVARNRYGTAESADGTFTTPVETPRVPVAAPTQAPAPAATPTPTPEPMPEPGKTVVVRPVSGKVLVRRPGSREFVEVDAAQGIPLGSTVDARHGVVELTAAAGQTARFHDGIFKVTQSGATTDLTLTEALAPCGTARTAAKKPKSRKLWGEGTGSFRTRGQYSSATVRGTTWLVQDTCAGTLTRVTEGVVAVRDIVKGRTVVVRAGKRYLARPRR